MNLIPISATTAVNFDKIRRITKVGSDLTVFWGEDTPPDLHINGTNMDLILAYTGVEDDVIIPFVDASNTTVLDANYLTKLSEFTGGFKTGLIQIAAEIYVAENSIECITNKSGVYAVVCDKNTFTVTADYLDYFKLHFNL